MYVIAHGQLDRHAIPGIQHRTVIGRALGTEAFEAWDQTVAPGAGTPPHRHDCEEAVVVLHGSGTVMVGGKSEPFAAPCTLVLPADVPHQIVNSGSEPLHIIGIFAASPAKALTPDGQPLPLPWEAPLAAAA